MARSAATATTETLAPRVPLAGNSSSIANTANAAGDIVEKVVRNPESTRRGFLEDVGKTLGRLV